ncbi:DNA-damage-repair/toleration protein DRT111 [Hirschfeldia incana]|nr:DNA-damage-repair/toleration protein DRT111 [Hirschfeldia incana]
MLGGLYGDLPPPSDDDKPTGNSSSSVWSSSTKMAPPTLRKPPAFAPTQTIIRPQNNKPKPLPSQQYKPPPPPPSTQSILTPVNNTQPALVGVTSSVIEEYDPARPNDYEEYRREKKKKAMEAEMKRELDKRRREEEERDRERQEKERERERDHQTPLNISGEEAWKRRAAMSGGGKRGRSSSPPPGNSVDGGGFSMGKSETSGLGVGAGGQMTAAERMMAKMGWKQGQGLGKSEQGITTPLMAKKTDRRAGVIVNASEKKAVVVKGVNISGEPTRVLLLRNMVGPGEVDDELEEEVGSECGKYGTVTRVLIFEITEPNFPTHEAVRIFVQFSRPEETTKALVDLDGRFFGGRTVRATFYDEVKFSKNELAPVPGEIPGY